jgi:signal transduction histidine kinase
VERQNVGDKLMGQKKLFDRTRRQIATWYGVGTGLILTLVCSYSYWIIFNSYNLAVDRELQSLAGTLHDSLEPKLSKPGAIGVRIDQEVIPHLCIVDENCQHVGSHERHALGISHQPAYYLKFYTLAGRVVAYSGNPPANFRDPQLSTTLLSFQDSQNQHYHRIVVILKNIEGQSWGFLEVGRSLADLDRQLAKLRWEFAIALPGLMLTICGLSWYLAGRTMKPIYQSYQKMQQFTADASHELRTPLTAMQATVELVRNYQKIDSAAAANSLAILDRQTTRLIQLTQDLLLLSRLDEPLSMANIPRWRIGSAIAEIILGFQALSATKEIQLSADLQENILVKIDRSHLEQLMSNLILNAIDHTPPGGTISVVLQRTGNSALLKITDTGIGMTLDIQERVFDRFFRASKNRDRKKGGTGLGLAIVQSIVQSYGGSIEVRSQLERGSTFLIQLPLG